MKSKEDISLVGKATHEELCDGAIKHYNELSDKCYHWWTLPITALEFYKKYGKEGAMEEYAQSQVELYRTQKREEIEKMKTVWITSKDGKLVDAFAEYNKLIDDILLIL